MGKKSDAAGGGVPRTPTRIQRELLIAALVDSLDDAGMELLATRVFERPYDVFNPRWVRSEIALKIVERAESQRRLDDLQREATKLNPDNELLHTWFLVATQRLSTPYRGLSPFQVNDASVFFGRDAFADRLAEAVNQRQIITLTAASGAGKSSLVFAGLIPRLRNAGGWIDASFCPGTDPFDALAECLTPLLEPEMTQTDQLAERGKLAASLRKQDITVANVIDCARKGQDPSSRLLLVVDQFEDLFAPIIDPGERDAFLKGLLAAFPPMTGCSPAVLVLTLRADSLAYALSHPLLAEALPKSVLKLDPMSRDELKEAVERPASSSDIPLEEGLTALILDDIGDQPGSLALLQFTMTRLAELLVGGPRQQPISLLLPQVHGALIQHADEVVRSLEATQHDFWRAFTHLVKPGDGANAVRRKATRAEVGDRWTLIERLADERLVVTDRDQSTGDDTAELAHDVLLDLPALRKWVDQDADFLRWLDRLRTDMQTWDETGAFLLGAPLAVAKDWLHKRQSDLSPHQQSFIQASIRHQKAKNARTAVAVAVVIGALFVASAIFYRQWQDTNKAREDAADAHARSASQQFAQLSEDRLDDQLDLALLLGVEALQTKDTSEAGLAILRGLATSPRLRTILQEHGEPVSAVGVSPDGQLLASGSTDAPLVLWNLNSTPVEQTILGDEDTVRSLAFSPRSDEQLLAIGTLNGTVDLWQFDNLVGIKRAQIVGLGDTVTSVAFDKEGRTLAAGTADGTISVWDVLEGDDWAVRALHDPLGGGRQHANAVTGLAFAPEGAIGQNPDGSSQGDGRFLVSGSADGSLLFWDVDAGLMIGEPLVGLTESVWSVAFNPDGDAHQIAVGGVDGRIILLDSTTRQSTAQLVGPSAAAVTTLAFTPPDDPTAGTQLASGSTDGNIMLWDVDSHAVDKQIATLHSHDDFVTSLAISRNGQTLASGGFDGGVLLWDVARPAGRRVEWKDASKTGPDSDVVVTDGENSVAITSQNVFSVLSADWLKAQACPRANDREFTLEELNRYFPGQGPQGVCSLQSAEESVDPTST